LRYVDSSSLLKLLWDEPESAAVRAAVSIEQRVVVSVLAELEVEVQLRARWLGGSATRARYRGHREAFSALRETLPFEFQTLPSEVFRRAIDQHLATNRHCRTLDRLHLTAMELLGVTQLMTNDTRQAEAARALGYHVVVPS
jgi:predicted nucleic acid-binding protein